MITPDQWFPFIFNPEGSLKRMRYVFEVMATLDLFNDPDKVVTFSEGEEARLFIGYNNITNEKEKGQMHIAKPGSLPAEGFHACIGDCFSTTNASIALSGVLIHISNLIENTNLPIVESRWYMCASRYTTSDGEEIIDSDYHIRQATKHGKLPSKKFPVRPAIREEITATLIRCGELDISSQYYDMRSNKIITL